MAKIWGILEKAQAEPLASDPALAPDGRVYYSTVSGYLRWYSAVTSTWDAVVGQAAAQVITAKDYDGGTASNTSRMTMPKAAIATLAALTRKQATYVYATDAAEKRPYYDDGTSLIPLIGPLVTGTVGAPSLVVAVTGIVISTKKPWEETQFVQGSGGAIAVSANPQVPVGDRVGQRLILIGTDNTATVTIFNGTGLDLNGAIVIDSNQAIALMWDGTNWRELWRKKG